LAALPRHCSDRDATAEALQPAKRFAANTKFADRFRKRSGQRQSRRVTKCLRQVTLRFRHIAPRITGGDVAQLSCRTRSRDLVRAQRTSLVRATFADALVARIGPTRGHLLRGLPLVCDPRLSPTGIEAPPIRDGSRRFRRGEWTDCGYARGSAVSFANHQPSDFIQSRSSNLLPVHRQDPGDQLGHPDREKRQDHRRVDHRSPVEPQEARIFSVPVGQGHDE
jgi:hypothetical protein